MDLFLTERSNSPSRGSVTVFEEKYGKAFRHPETNLSGLTLKGLRLVTEMKGLRIAAIPEIENQ